MTNSMKFICGAFVVLAVFLFLLRNHQNSRLSNGEAEADAEWKPGPLGRLINSSALISVVLLLLPLDQLWYT